MPEIVTSSHQTKPQPVMTPYKCRNTAEANTVQRSLVLEYVCQGVLNIGHMIKRVYSLNAKNEHTVCSCYVR